MDKQSQPSTQASAAGGQESTRQRLAQVQRRAVQGEMAKTESGAQPIGESILKTIGRFPGCDKIVTGVRALYDRSSVPKRHLREIDDRASPPEWVRARNRVCEQLGSGFLVALLGKRGPGKTQIAQQAVMATIGIGRAALYVRAMTIFLELRATFKADEKTEEAVIEKYRAPKFLVIDEMQERGETPWEDRTLNHLIDLRYGDMTDTLLIANLQPKAFKSSVGESIADRLRETGGIIECTWKSFRQSG